MKKQTTQHHMDGLLALLLFSVFAVCVLSVLLTGANAYRRLTQRDQDAYNRRTCVQYLATRVRQSDMRDGVFIEDFDGIPALFLTDQYGYVTRVYCYEGQLMELYAAPDAELIPEDGEAIMEIEALDLSLADRFLTVSVTDAQGQKDSLCLSLRCGEEAAA